MLKLLNQKKIRTWQFEFRELLQCRKGVENIINSNPSLKISFRARTKDFSAIFFERYLVYKRATYRYSRQNDEQGYSHKLLQQYRICNQFSMSGKFSWRRNNTTATTNSVGDFLKIIQKIEALAWLYNNKLNHFLLSLTKSINLLPNFFHLIFSSFYLNLSCTAF